MTTLVHITVTDEEALDMRMALNAASCFWGDKARAARQLGNEDDAATCERIRAGYGALWKKVAAAQQASAGETREALSTALARTMFRPLADRERDADAAFAAEFGD